MNEIQILETTEEIISLRKQLHEIPELAFSEKKTMAMLAEWLKAEPGLKVEVFDSFLAASIRGSDETLPPVAFRADFDAVCGQDGMPGHYCGHDGHAAILAGFARFRCRTGSRRSVYFCFQPAEETGEGAQKVLPYLLEKGVTEIYGFHNIPGFRENEILVTDKTFACASTGMELKFIGTPSHAAYPENGKNPALAIAELILGMNGELQKPHRGIVLGTVISIEAGKEAYGVSASEGTLRLTLRGEFQEEFEAFCSWIVAKASQLAERDGLRLTVTEKEPFPATENDREGSEKIRRSAERSGCTIRKMEQPFRWSEDFGHYLMKIRGAFFGVGDGIDHPQLHTEQYEFPDAICMTVLRVFDGILDDFASL